MKMIFKLGWVFFQLFLIHSTAFANDELTKLNRNLFISTVDQDFDQFKEYLSLGANPNIPTEDTWYASTAFCESTKPGNEKFLNYLIDNVEGAWQLVISGVSDSPAECAIQYDNVAALDKFVSMGLDEYSNLYSKEPELTPYTLFDKSLIGNREESMWYLIQKIELTYEQKQDLVRTLERFGGFEGTESIQYYEKLANWLIEQGIPVNLASPAPDPRKLKR